MKMKALSIAAVLLVLATGCSNPTDTSQPTLRGYITVVDATRNRVLVEEVPSEPAVSSHSGKVFFSLGDYTEVRTSTGGHLSTSDLAVGQFVSAWSTGIMLDSYPGQTDAKRVVVELK